MYTQNSLPTSNNLNSLAPTPRYLAPMLDLQAPLSQALLPPSVDLEVARIGSR